MLPRSQRIRRSTDIQAVRDGGVCTAIGPLRVCLLKTNEQQSRFACIVSKRVSASAVRRHRLRRLLSELVRNVQAKTGEAGSYDMVISAQPPLNSITTLRELKERVERPLASFIASHT